MADDINLDVDDIDLGFGDIGDDLSFDPMEPDNDRSPTRRVLDGAVEELTSRESAIEGAKKTAYSALPEGYRKSLDSATSGLDDIKSIYDKAAKDLDPTVTKLKSIGRKALPKAERYLPKSLAERLERLTREKPESALSDRVDPNETALAAAMADVFGAETVRAEIQEAKADEQRVADKKLDDIKFKTSTSIRETTLAGISRLVAYQDNILSKYHRKSLELQHRLYFTARDQLVHHKAAQADVMTALKTIAKNSALPNEQKVLLNEAVMANSRDMLAGRIHEGVQRRLGKVPENIRNYIETKVQGGVSTINSMAGMADMVDGVGDSVDMYEMGGSMAAEEARDYGAGFLGGKLQSQLLRNRRVAAINQRLLGITEDIPRAMYSKLMDGEGRVYDFLRAAAGMESADGETVQANLSGSLLGPATYDIQTRMSIVEVIPGYLSRILQGIVGGDRLVFDPSRMSFKSQSEAIRDISNRMTARQGNLQSEGDALLQVLDPDSKLPPADAQELLFRLTKDSDAGRKFDPKRYLNDMTLPETTRSVIAQSLGMSMDGKLSGNPDDLARINDASHRFNRLGVSNGNLSEIINDTTLAGNRDLLSAMGLIHETGIEGQTVNFDMKDALIRHRLGGGDIHDLLAASGENPAGLKTIGTRRASTPSRTAGKAQREEIRQMALTIESQPTLEQLLQGHRVSNEERLDKLISLFEAGLITQTVGPEATVETIKSDPAYKGVMGKIMDAATATASGAGSILRGHFSMLGSMGSGIKGAFGSMRGRTRGLGSSLQGMTDKAKEQIQGVWVDGAQMPRLTKAKLMNGEYYNAVTGEVITRWEDIKDGVKDIDGADILTQMELARASLTDNMGARLPFDFSGAIDRVKGFLGSGFKLQGRLLTGALSLPGKIKDFFKRPKDLYIPGDVVPRLRAAMFEAGQYFSATTGQPLRSHQEIDGDVVDKEGNLILSIQELNQGLTDRVGNYIEDIGIGSRLRSVGERLWSMGGKALQMGINASKRTIGAARSIIGGIGSALRRHRGGFGANSPELDPANADSDTILMAIYNHMRAYWPLNEESVGDKLDDLHQALAPEKVRGDTDGDGFRENSWRDQRAEDAKVEGSGASPFVGPPKPMRRGRPLSERLTALAAAGSAKLRTKRRKETLGEDEEDKDDGFIRGAVTSGIASMGTAALVAGKGALLTVGGSLVSGASALAAAAASVLTAPVLLTVGTIAAVGTAGYFAYKAWARRKPLLPIERLRMLQYGVPINNSEAIVAVRYLEDKLSDDIKVTAEGKVELDIDFPEIWDDFGADFGNNLDNPIHQGDFYEWFYKRFMQVFAAYKVAALREVGDIDVLDLDSDLPKDRYVTFLARIHFGRHDVNPYNVARSPWPDIELVDNRYDIEQWRGQIIQSAERGTLEDLPSPPTDNFVTRTKNTFRRWLGYDVEEPPVQKDAAAVAASVKRKLPHQSLDLPDGHDGLVMPVVGGRISSPFGMRTHPTHGDKRPHHGIDIAAPAGTPVYAAADGIVERADYSDSYGNVIYLAHTDGRFTRYAHLAKMYVRKGDAVTAGMVIGLVGNTGISTGPHLHFEYRDNDRSDSAWSNANKALDPMRHFGESLPERTRRAQLENERMSKRADTDDHQYARYAASTQQASPLLTGKDLADEMAEIGAGTALRDNGPTVHVAAPDLTGINSVTMEAANYAAHQRDVQVDLMTRQTEQLAILAEAIRMQNNIDQETMARAAQEVKRRKDLQTTKSKTVNLPFNVNQTG